MLSTGLALIMLAQAAPAAAAGAEAPPLTTASVIDSAPASDWRTIADDRLLVMEVNGGQVLIELADEFAPAHSANIKQLAKQHYFDGLAIVRVQENYVVQWGDPDADEGKARSFGDAKSKLPAEFDRERGALPWQPIPDPDAYAAETGFSHGFPVGRDAERAWLLHCYAMVGAGRGNEADSSTGAELYVVSGHSPRHLDRNITLVGRVIEGMPVLTTLPRGTGPLGFYEKPEQRVKIEHIRLASEIEPSKRPRRQRLSTESASFAKLIQARRFRQEDWFVNKVGHIEVCNVPMPIRPVP